MNRSRFYAALTVGINNERDDAGFRSREQHILLFIKGAKLFHVTKKGKIVY